MPSRHQPVLMEQVLEALQPERGGFFVDATVGGGGHAHAILSAHPGNRLLAIDRDVQALERAKERLAEFGDRVIFEHAPFSAVVSLVEAAHSGKVDGILADFGVSSDQIDDRERGFSFMQDGPLDMRMDRTKQKTSAARLLADSSEDEIEHWLRDYGEERYARRIANAIVKQRRFGPLLRTSQLADLVGRTIPSGRSGHHVATRTFQGIRIAVNRELDEIEVFLQATPKLLAEGGRLAVISFHSLEDRACKVALRNEARGGDFKNLIPRGATANQSEIRKNPRSRSARLRAIECVSKGGQA
ncbi:MAG: 16S rRNA (cytosine(1402)-N(4))-methyltransferase RsmH [Planctomycetota bacterium]|nr:16S rRNA (cytosine(1402)-N(4))-methyltransferase RsmH [Planctomycetota bacterium]MDA1114437.1 16S rRNA (cytosine(1402)-N(4))-methyltransferase RsmH [Planctomycetota bacterium]